MLGPCLIGAVVRGVVQMTSKNREEELKLLDISFKICDNEKDLSFLMVLICGRLL